MVEYEEDVFECTAACDALGDAAVGTADPVAPEDAPTALVVAIDAPMPEDAV
jgi:hypothetical protein